MPSAACWRRRVDAPRNRRHSPIRRWTGRPALAQGLVEDTDLPVLAEQAAGDGIAGQSEGACSIMTGAHPGRAGHGGSGRGLHGARARFRRPPDINRAFAWAQPGQHVRNAARTWRWPARARGGHTAGEESLWCCAGSASARSSCTAGRGWRSPAPAASWWTPTGRARARTDRQHQRPVPGTPVSPRPAPRWSSASPFPTNPQPSRLAGTWLEAGIETSSPPARCRWALRLRAGRVARGGRGPAFPQIEMRRASAAFATAGRGTLGSGCRAIPCPAPWVHVSSWTPRCVRGRSRAGTALLLPLADAACKKPGFSMLQKAALALDADGRLQVRLLKGQEVSRPRPCWPRAPGPAALRRRRGSRRTRVPVYRSAPAGPPSMD